MNAITAHHLLSVTEIICVDTSTSDRSTSICTRKRKVLYKTFSYNTPQTILRINQVVVILHLLSVEFWQSLIS